MPRNRLSARPSHGFALLMTLVLLALAAVALAGVASRSLTAAVEARDAEQAVQRQWAQRSARSTLLARAPHAFADAELPPSDEAANREDDDASRGTGNRNASSGRFEPLTRIAFHCELAGLSYRFVLTDEQARFNVNAVDRRASTPTFTRRVEPLIGDADLDLRRPATGPGGRLLIASFDQLFQHAPPEALLGTDRRPGPATRVTCWGPGTVNVRRAPDAVVAAACDDALSSRVIDDLLEARRRSPDATLTGLLDTLDRVTSEQRERLRGVLTEASSTFGLWIVAQRPQRAWHSFSVYAPTTRSPGASEATDPAADAASSDGGSIQPRTFSW